MKKKKEHRKKSRGEKKILAVIAVLCVLAVCVAGYGVWSVNRPDGSGSGDVSNLTQKGIDIQEGMSFIKKVSIGDAYADVVPDEEEGKFRIEASLPIETDTTQISCTLELYEGAYLSEDSNCIINDLGGQLLLNLGVEDAKLVISDGTANQTYTIVLSISE